MFLIFFCTTIINDTHVYIKLEWFRDAHRGGGQYFFELKLKILFIILKTRVANAGPSGYFWPLRYCERPCWPPESSELLLNNYIWILVFSFANIWHFNVKIGTPRLFQLNFGPPSFMGSNFGPFAEKVGHP